MLPERCQRRWLKIVEFADRRSERGLHCNIQDGLSGIMPVFPKHHQREVVCLVAIGICKIPEAGADDDELALCRSLQNQNAVDLHVGPTKSLDALRSRRSRHGPADEVVCEREGFIIFQAPRAGVS